MDYPRNIAVPSHIGSLSKWLNGLTMHNTASIGGGASFAWTANTAVYIPLTLPFPYRVARAFWFHGTVISGNVDIGIYSKGGTRLWSAGSTGNTGSSSQPQFVTVTPDLLLHPGRYWVAYVHDGTTNQSLGSGTLTNPGRMGGLYQQATALPLPATATFAAYAGVGYPMVGITNTASGF